MLREADRTILCLLAVSLCVNVFLYRQWGPATMPSPSLRAGDRLPPLRGTALDGSAVTESFTRPTILYAFSPSCSWCERNLDNARAIASAAGNRYKFVAIATVDAGIEDYVRRRGIDWDIIKNVPAQLLGAYQIRGTPQTIFVDVGGTVLHSWSGAYLEPAEREVEGALGVSLPGLK